MDMNNRLKHTDSALPSVGRDIRSFSGLKDVSVSDILTEAKGKRGRRAQSDQVARCLLRNDLREAMPLRREDRIARNRRRIIAVFLLFLLWWGLWRLFL